MTTSDVLPTAPPKAAVASNGNGPWATAFRRLSRNRSAIIGLGFFILIVIACLLAPVYAHSIAHVDAFNSNIDGTIHVDGQDLQVMQPNTEGLGLGVTPIGPTWDFSTYFLGADTQGRDVFARLLYGGRNSLMIASISTVLCLIMATIVGLAAGFLGGWTDSVLSRLMDILWAFPVYLLAISLSIVLIQGLTIGPIHLTSGSLALPILIIAIVYVPYVARPIRGQVITLKNAEFVTAAVGLGVPPWRILYRDILPNILPTLIVFVPLMMVLNMSTEAALSFLSVGVQSPDASWGTIIQDGESLLYTRPWVSIAPGMCIAATILSLNIFGDGVSEAFDPRAKGGRK
ncbi:ABC transporter permease [Allorhizobium sp. BGMRC 0089]|uniref:ABC transporter permease n=1 Tax=Allorhizobium sonneratiae TaxID=2934936 RepID=UPI0020345E75|nr:ABC transporter permease [Allorhizobium sonneratiae]MCM2293129.1 ABC transporter permease [Allorhizobium sonneratiae]